MTYWEHLIKQQWGRLILGEWVILYKTSKGVPAPLERLYLRHRARSLQPPNCFEMYIPGLFPQRSCDVRKFCPEFEDV